MFLQIQSQIGDWRQTAQSLDQERIESCSVNRVLPLRSGRVSEESPGIPSGLLLNAMLSLHLSCYLTRIKPRGRNSLGVTLV